MRFSALGLITEISRGSSSIRFLRLRLPPQYLALSVEAAQFSHGEAVHELPALPNFASAWLTFVEIEWSTGNRGLLAEPVLRTDTEEEDDFLA